MPAVLRATLTLLLFIVPWGITTASEPDALSGKAAGPPGEPAGLESRAREFVGLLAAGRFVEATTHYNASMKAALPAQKLKAAWKQLLTQAGAFQEATATRMQKIQGHDVVLVTSRFEKVTLDVKVVYNAERQVSGLFFVPARPRVSSVIPPYSDPRRFREEEVAVGGEAWSLPATLSMARGEGRSPGIVLVHGSGPQDRDETVGPNKPFRDLAWGLASRGVAVLRYEKRTLVHGARIAGMAGDFTVRDETIDDAIEAVNLLRSREEVDCQRIFVAGHSLGGMLVPRIGMLDRGIAGFVILAGAARPLQEMMVEQVRHIASLDGQLSDADKDRIRTIQAAVTQIDGLDASAGGAGSASILGAPPSYWLDLRDYEPHEMARSLQRPLLILQGGRDYQVTGKDFELWRAALDGRSDVSFRLYPALNHLFMQGEGAGRPSEYEKAGNVAGEVIEEIAEWILAQAPLESSHSACSTS